MKKTFLNLVCASILVAQSHLQSAHAQNAFQDLNFESGKIVLDASNPFYPFAANGAAAFPGWRLIGTFAYPDVLYNNATGGSASIDIMGLGGQSQPAYPIIAGNFTAVLEAGVLEQSIVSATLEQSGQIPASAKSLLFDAAGDVTGGLFTVHFNGQNLPIYPLAAGPNGSEEYGADISAYAGQTGPLDLSENPIGQINFGTAALDNISFSPSSIPEPRTYALMVCGLVVLACQSRRKTRK